MYERITPINQALILINVGVFLLQLWLGGSIEARFALWPQSSEFGSLMPFRPWQLLTYGFLHANWMHLFFNMFALYMFGSDIERVLGRQRYVVYYLLSVIGAALMHMIVVRAAGLPPNPVVGASGGVFGVLLGFGMMFPRRTVVLLIPPIPMPAWLFVTLYGVAELVMGLTQTAQGVAHFAHLGGMVTGLVILRYWTAQARRLRTPQERER